MGRGQVRRDRGSGGGDRGAAAVEFALVALPLFLILFGIIQYGFLFYELQGAAATSKDAAKWASEGMADCAEWGARTTDLAAGYGVTANLSPTFEAEYDLQASPGPTVTVKVGFTPLRFVPLVPIPDQIVRTATTDVQVLPTDPAMGTTCTA